MKNNKLKILIVNGVNMDMLGKRNPSIYGSFTLKQLNKEVASYVKNRGAKACFYFSAIEGKLAQKIAKTRVDGVLLNAGAYSHYSIALRDAIECANAPVVEVHLSDIFSRENFRKNRVFADVVLGCFSGKGKQSYFDGVDFLVDYLTNQKN